MTDYRCEILFSDFPKFRLECDLQIEKTAAGYKRETPFWNSFFNFIYCRNFWIHEVSKFWWFQFLFQ